MMGQESKYSGPSVPLFDLAPDDGGAPCEIQAEENYAKDLIAALPNRYRFPLAGESPPPERSDGAPIDPDAGK